MGFSITRKGPTNIVAGKCVLSFFSPIIVPESASWKCRSFYLMPFLDISNHFKDKASNLHKCRASQLSPDAHFQISAEFAVTVLLRPV